MSMWVHIIAAIHVETYVEEKDLETYIKEKLKNAPKITGSESNADIFINKKSGFNTWTNCDCEHCEYKKTIKNCGKNKFTCESPDDFQCPEGKYQTRAVITVLGDLRDRILEETTKEYEEFILYISNTLGWDITINTVQIEAG